MMTWLSVSVLAACGTVEHVQYERPLAEQMSLVLSADRSTYYAGEVVRLVTTARNDSGAAVRGNFALNPACGLLEIRYRKVPGDFTPIGIAQPTSFVKKGDLYLQIYNEDVVTATTIGVGEGKSTETRLALDGHRHLLNDPGEYEFQAVFRDASSGPNALLSSNVISVKVSIPVGQDKTAFEEYSKHQLAALAEYSAGRSAADQASIKRAEQFLSKYPLSPYAEQVREGLRGALKERIGRNRASKEERELHKQLEQERLPTQ